MKLSRPIRYLAQLAITVGAIYFTFSQVKIHEVTPLLRTIPWSYLVGCILLVHGSQFASAARTRYYLHCQAINFPFWPSMKLHYIGGLFNAFLPGGAGGDAYKVWWLKRYKQGKLLNMVTLVLANRLNGLWMVGVCTCVLGLFSVKIRELIPFGSGGIVAIAIAGSAGYMLLARIFLKESIAQQVHAAMYSLVLQLALITVCFLVCFGLGLQEHAIEYTFLFMFACVLAMMPISIGGIGVREISLLHGSVLLGLQQEPGVTLGFIFTLFTLTIPLVGAVVYHFYGSKKRNAFEADTL